MTLYDDLLAAGVPLDHHYSDLYFPVTPQTTEILARHFSQERIATTFASQTDNGEPWYEVPFAYLPYWEDVKAGRIPILPNTL